ncbi:MAG: O-methyltransferase [Bacilli bacterium]|nr:O-methyltransferase [Bacilli bacterium]
MVGLEYEIIRRIKKYAEDNNVPIMQDAGMDFLTTFLIKNKIRSVLEIGTAIGYSAIMMALTNPYIKITSVERDEKRYLEALRNIKELHLDDRITLIFKDALDLKLGEKFDLIFLDAAKAQNINFFHSFSRNLNSNGFIITDNLEFHGLVEKDEKEIKSRNVRALVRKIKEYIHFLEQNVEYETIFYKIGDGLSVSQLKK